MSEDYIPYGRQSIDEDDIRAVVDVLRGDWLTTGPTVSAFESALSAATGGHPVLAVNSGTAALHCAYAAAGLGPGTTMVTTPLTFVATAAAAVHLGADVLFADIDDETLCIDPASVARVMTPETRVITGVDFAGVPCDWPALRSIADETGAILVDDAAHAIGSRLHGRPMGDWADLTTFSFHPVKTITTAEGGAVVVKNRDLLREVELFRNHGLVRDPDEMRLPDEGPWHQEVHRFGLNYRMPDLNAALGLSQLSKLDTFVRERARIVGRYREALKGLTELRLQSWRGEADPAFHLFPLRVARSRRRSIFQKLQTAGIGAQVHYVPAYRHPVFLELGVRTDQCPVAEDAYERLISLPLHPGLTDRQQDHVLRTLESLL